jgi:hypothetical protein
MHFIKLVLIVAISLFLAPPAVEQPGVPKENKPELKYHDVKSVANDGTVATGIGDIADGNLEFTKLKTGYTLVPVETADPNKSLVVVSAARDPKSPNAAVFRVVAIDRNGKRHEATSQSAANGSGTKHDVVTLVCEFPLAKKDVREWILQRGVRYFKASVGITTAVGIIDEDADSEENPGVEQP